MACAMDSNVAIMGAVIGSAATMTATTTITDMVTTHRNGRAQGAITARTTTITPMHHAVRTTTAMARGATLAMAMHGTTDTNAKAAREVRHEAAATITRTRAADTLEGHVSSTVQAQMGRPKYLTTHSAPTARKVRSPQRRVVRSAETRVGRLSMACHKVSLPLAAHVRKAQRVQRPLLLAVRLAEVATAEALLHHNTTIQTPRVALLAVDISADEDKKHFRY